MNGTPPVHRPGRGPIGGPPEDWYHPPVRPAQPDPEAAMLARLLASAVVATALAGCGKKAKDTAPAAGGSGEGGDGRAHTGPREPEPTGPAYTIKSRKDKAGDKFAVTEFRSSRMKGGGKEEVE